jgi:PAS domain S-box-containing protein
LAEAADAASADEDRIQEAEAVLRRLAGALGAPPVDEGLQGLAFAVRDEERPPTRVEPWRAPPDAPMRTLDADALRHLLEAVPDALVVVDDGGRIVLVNAQAEEMFGYRREELRGRPVEVLVPERFREQHVGQRGEYFAVPYIRPMGKEHDLYGRRKDGREVPVEISLSPLRIPSAATAEAGGGEAELLVVASIRDISERKRAETQLRNMETRYRTLVEGIPAVTFMAALDEGAQEGELYVSPQIEALLGFSHKEWLENPVLWYAQLHPEDRRRWHGEFAHTIVTGEPFRSDYRFLSRDGRVVWVHGEAKVVRDADGRPLFLQGVAFDITSIKQAEEKLQALNQTLEERVAERTRAAEEHSRELERSNQDLTHFNFFVGHEVKKPLTPLVDAAQDAARLLQRRRAPAVVERLEEIIRIAEDMDLRIKRMLQYAKVGSELKLRPIDCTAVVRAAQDCLREQIEECGAKVKVKGGRLPTVLGDEELLAQVVENLIGNAIKYRAKKRRLKVDVGAEYQDGEWRLWVKDNGEGIKKDYIDKIFVLFKRLHAEEIPGHGIGLSFTKKVIEHHGGRIWVESEYGKWSTFFFTLPAVPEPDPPRESPPTEQPKKAPVRRKDEPAGRGRRPKSTD